MIFQALLKPDDKKSKSVKERYLFTLRKGSKECDQLLIKISAKSKIFIIPCIFSSYNMKTVDNVTNSLSSIYNHVMNVTFFQHHQTSA